MAQNGEMSILHTQNEAMLTLGRNSRILPLKSAFSLYFSASLNPLSALSSRANQFNKILIKYHLYSILLTAKMVET